MVAKHNGIIIISEETKNVKESFKKDFKDAKQYLLIAEKSFTFIR